MKTAIMERVESGDKVLFLSSVLILFLEKTSRNFRISNGIFKTILETFAPLII